MRQKDRIDELEAVVEHLQKRIDGLRDYIKDNPTYTDAEYCWNKFEDLLAWAKEFDANSKEYERLTEIGWRMLDKYLECLMFRKLGGEK